MDRKPPRSYSTHTLPLDSIRNDGNRGASRDHEQSSGREARQYDDDRRDRHRRDDRGSRDRSHRDSDERPYRDRDTRRYRDDRSYRDERDDRGYRRDERGYRDRREDHRGRDRWDQRDRNDDQPHESRDLTTNVNLPAKPTEKPRQNKPDSQRDVKSDGQKKPAVEAEEKKTEGEEEDDAAAQMARMMGFSSFDSSKGKKGVDVGGVARTKASSFRQYMNRDKGFNRELSPPPAERRRK